MQVNTAAQNVAYFSGEFICNVTTSNTSIYILNEHFKFIAISVKYTYIHKKYIYVYLSFLGIFTVLIWFVLNNCNKDVSPVIETHLTNACKTLEMMCCENNMVTQSHHVCTISIEL